MSIEDVEQVLDRLSEDPEFKYHLMGEPNRALEQYDLTLEERDLLYRMIHAIHAKSAEGQEHIRTHFLDKLLQARAAEYVSDRSQRTEWVCIGDGASMSIWAHDSRVPV